MQGIEALNTDIEGFRYYVDYHIYRLQNHSSYLEPFFSPALHKAKSQIGSLNLTLGTFDVKDPMEIFSFLAQIGESFDGHDTP